MKQKKGAVIAGAWVLCALLIAIVFVTGILDKQQVWTDVPLDDHGHEDRSWSLERGDAYGVVATGPYYDLPVGQYRLKWQIEGDGDNRITLSCSNDAEITPREIAVPGEHWEGEAWFEIMEHTHSLSINVEFASGTFMKMHNVRLYSPMYRDDAFTFAAAMIALCLLLTLYLRGWMTMERRQTLVVLGMAVVIASSLCLQANSPLSYDTHFHAARLMNLADGLRAGQIPVRVGGFSYNGYGAMTSVFYPDLLLYPWALMLLGGASMTYVINTLVIAVNVLTAWCMFACARRILGSREAAVCASVLYVLCIYRLEDIYCRLMVGEMLAMAFLPVFLLGLYEVVLGKKERWPLLALGATLIFRSHMLTTVLCAGMAAVLCVLLFRQIIRERRLPAILLAALAALLINLNQIVPMIMAFKAGVNTTVWQFGFADAALSLRSLLMEDKYLGMALMAGIAAFLVFEWSTLEDSDLCILKIVFWGGITCAILSTDLIPWHHIVKLTGGLVETLQFPWRFMVLAVLCFSLCGGAGMARLLGGKGARAMICTLALAIVCSLPYMRDMQPYDYDLEFGQGAKTYMIYPEYQIAGTDVNDTRSRATLLDGDVQLTAYHKDGTRIDARVEATGDAQVSFALFGFPGYEARIDGQKADWMLGENNRLTVTVPAGVHDIQIRYAGRALWTAMDMLSLIAALGLAGYVIMRKKRCAN